MIDQTTIHPKKRDANIELLRIVAMVGIVLCHILAHGGVKVPAQFGLGSVVFSCIGPLGAIADSIFVLITGYFSVHSTFKPIKVLRLVFQVTFYSVALYVLACLLGGAAFSVKHLIQSAVPFLSGGGYWFIVMYIELYCLSPLLNAGIRGISKRQLQFILILFIALFSFIPKIIGKFISTNDFGYSRFAWLVLVYGIGAYIRLYPPKIMEKKRLMIGLWLLMMLVFFFVKVLGTVQSMIPSGVLLRVVRLLGATVGNSLMNGFFPLTIAVLTFIVFKNMNVPSYGWIYVLASSAFGVYLIHDHITFRDCLWGALKTAEWQGEWWFIPYCFGIVAAMYPVFALIDRAREKFLEKPLFGLKIFQKEWLKNK